MSSIIRKFYKLENKINNGDEITVPQYMVGKNQLLFFYLGVLCAPGNENQYTEVGNDGDFSTKLAIHFDCNIGDDIAFIVFDTNS
jgi:hypothetical protein